MQVFAMNEWFRGQPVRRIYRLNLTRLFEDVEVDWQKVSGRKSAIGQAIMLCADISESSRYIFHVSARQTQLVCHFDDYPGDNLDEIDEQVANMLSRYLGEPVEIGDVSEPATAPRRS